MKLLSITLVILITVSGFFLQGCKDDNDSNLEIGTPNIAGEMMTLSAIAYIADSSSPEIIKDSIEYQLNNNLLTTKGKWKLAWGPAISLNNENLVFVAKNISAEAPVYAICIRGTNVNSIGDIVEDLNVFRMVEFSFGSSGDSVAKGAMDGFMNLITSKDPTTFKSLEDYLTSLSLNTKTDLFVTGHSQGGGLAPLMSYWLLKNSQITEKFNVITYAFAGPGWVNKSFRENFISEIQPESFRMFVNSLDMIPYGYANLPQINSKNIPVHVPLAYRVLIAGADSLLRAEKIVYYNITIADTIGNIPVTSSTPGGLNPSDSIRWYNHWLMVEHNHNNYLKLLDAVPVN